MSKANEKKLINQKRLIEKKLGKLNSLTASGADKTMLHDALIEIDRQLALVKTPKNKRKKPCLKKQ